MSKKYRDSQGVVHMLLLGDPKSDWVEVDEDPTQGPDPNYRPPYNYLRMGAYPKLEEQLDMLWHELQTSGSISSTGSWFNTIKNVKDQFPKP